MPRSPLPSDGDYLISTRTAPQAAGGLETYFTLDTLGVRAKGPRYATFREAEDAGRLKAEHDQVTLWRDVATERSSRGAGVLIASFRPARA